MGKRSRSVDQSTTLHLIHRAWSRFPELRLCQLIETVLFTPLPNESCSHTIGADKFYIADEDLHRHLVAFLAHHEAA
jgi:hypothetical protein